MIESAETTTNALARENMIQRQIRPWNVLEPRVLDTLARVPREAFVAERFGRMAYSDLQLPIGHGEVMMEPRVEARMLQELDPQPDERALEVGTGSGFITACLAHLTGNVTSVELHADLLDSARQRLAGQGLDRAVRLERGDAALGWSDGQHYDVIAITGSLPELHQGFHTNLTLGGRLFVIVGSGPMMEALCITRTGPNAWSTHSAFDTSVPALRNLPTRSDFVL